LHVEEPDIPYPDHVLPREKVYGTKKFDSINTIIFSIGLWRGTVTAYGMDYREGRINGHASGGALTMLYHMNHDIVSAASMIEYQRWERFNMLDEALVENFMDLTPRLELRLDDNRVFRNICDHRATLTSSENSDELIIATKSRLVDGNQMAPDQGTPKVSIDYKIKDDVFTLEIAMDKPVAEGKLQFVLPVVCSGNDELSIEDYQFKLQTNKGALTIASNYKLETLLHKNKRVYNFVPGLQAFPLVIDCFEIHKEKLVLRFSV
jgi:hypothetical protein